MRHSRYITVVPQHDLYWPQLMVRDHVAIIRGLTPRVLRPNIKSTDHVLGLVGLAGHADKRAEALSERMRRRVWDAILTSKGANKALLVTSHDMAEVEALADVCCILRSGRVIARGSVDDLCAQSRVAYTLTVARGSPEEFDAYLAGPHGCARALAGRVLDDSEVNRVAQLVKYKLCRSADLEAAVWALSSAGCLAHAWELTHARLEEGFIDSVEREVA